MLDYVREICLSVPYLVSDCTVWFLHEQKDQEPEDTLDGGEEVEELENTDEEDEAEVELRASYDTETQEN